MTKNNGKELVKLSQTKGGKVKEFFRKNCVPTLVEDMLAIRRAKAEGEDVGRKPYLKAVGKYLARIAASMGVQFGSAYSVGVLAWQTSPGAPTTNSLDNASPIASAFASAIAGMVSPANQATAANTLLAVDYFLSAARIAAEQAVWRKYKITPDFPGTVLSPLVVGAGEMIYKTAALANMPDNPGMRLAQGIKGVYGNIVRLAMVGLIYLSGRIYNRVADSNMHEEKKGE